MDFLKAAHKWLGKTIMVLDGASQHRARIVREALKEMNGEVRLVFLPPGCPDLNAIEEIWRQMKHVVLDTPVVKFHKMCEDIDKWLVGSLPRLEIEKYLYRKGICSRCLRKFSDLGTDLTCFEIISYFSRHDVNTYQKGIAQMSCWCPA